LGANFFRHRLPDRPPAYLFDEAKSFIERFVRQPPKRVPILRV
jgi:hypothetical protein